MTCKERILSNDYADIIADFQIPEEFGFEPSIDYYYHHIEGELGVAYVERSRLPAARTVSRSYTFLPKCYGLMENYDVKSTQAGESDSSLALMASGILSVQGQPLSLTGKRVTIAFIDTGIQYQNKAFLDAVGRSRIRAIWDQTIQSGMPPEGFAFGTEYTREMIEEALKNPNPLSIVPTTDTNGHGTACASIAAGSRLYENGRFIGAAPDCDIVVVKLKEAKQYLREYYLIPEGVPCYQENDIMLALQYVERFVQNLYRPMVVCIGVGTSLGDHTGNTMLGRYMGRIMNRKSRVIVVAAGNEGNAGHHFHGEVSQTQPFRNVELRVASGVKGFVMDFWGGVPFLFTVTVRSPGGESIEWINPRIQRPQEFSFVFDKTILIIEYSLIEQTSGAELIRFRFENPTEGIWTIRVNAVREIVNGNFDIWLPITQFLSADTYFLEPDPTITLTDPSYVRRAVSATTYNDVNNSLYGNAGRGYARDGFRKPDIAAPGVEVSTILGERTGSSIAAAITAGGVAQILQWAVVEQNDIFADSESVRNYLIRGAARESSLSYPNREWGYGRLDVQGVFEFLASV